MNNRNACLVVISAVLIDVFSQAQAADNLEERYRRLSCSVVRIDFDGGSGTGFFIDKQGHMLTASHVIYERHWIWKNGLITLKLEPHKNFKMTNDIEGVKPFVIPDQSTINEINGNVDMVLVDTFVQNTCSLSLETQGIQSVGQHVMLIGYPNGNQTQVLYDGFISSIHQHWPVPLGKLEEAPTPNQVVTAKYDVYRIQMPLTPGVSGSPVIDDDDRVVAVDSEAPIVLASDIREVMRVYGLAGMPSSGITMGGFDAVKLIGELSEIVIEFQSPGAGFAVPVRYLARAQPDPLAVRP